MKLWQKGELTDQLFERFTIGQDPVLDLELAWFDVKASKAHAKMLGTIGLVSEKESKLLFEALDEIGKQIEEGRFVIEEGVEDCHSQIEMQLTEKLGEIGKKINSGRSRNDQVITAIKLYTKHHIKEIAGLVKELFDLLLNKSENTQNILMPGYTHMQVAMPSSFGLWFAAHAEALIDDLELMRAALAVADKNPLGSAAGYGASFPIDRDITTRESGFTGLNVNSIYAQMTRGKTEKTTAFALSGLAATLSRFSMDVCLYSGQDFGFFTLPTAFTTGSSIMPHKHNPDGFELVRGKCNLVQALPYQLSMVLANLPTGYHRDLQVLKEQYFPAIRTIKDCLQVLTLMVKGLEVNPNLIDQPKYEMLFTVEEVNKRVLAGVPFRDAYRQVGELIQNGEYVPDKKPVHTHIGSIGNLGNKRIRVAFDYIYEELK